MSALKTPAACESSARCAQCGIPLDAKYFDDSSVVLAPEPGRAVVLARFELPPQYCGVLLYFAQFTDQFGKDASQIATPGLFWTLRINQRPFYPYLDLEHIVNPWGFGSYQIGLRLDDSATVELTLRRTPGSRVSTTVDAIRMVGGRIMGRYWYNSAYGDVERSRG